MHVAGGWAPAIKEHLYSWMWRQEGGMFQVGIYVNVCVCAWQGPVKEAVLTYVADREHLRGVRERTCG